MTIDAAIGRQVTGAIQALQVRAGTAGIPGTVVVHLGNNGAFAAAQFDQIMTILGPDRRVVFVSLKVPEAWQDGNSANISAGVSRYANASLIDWHAATPARPELVARDEVHIGPTGGSLLTSVILAELSN